MVVIRAREERNSQIGKDLPDAGGRPGLIQAMSSRNDFRSIYGSAGNSPRYRRKNGAVCGLTTRLRWLPAALSDGLQTKTYRLVAVGGQGPAVELQHDKVSIAMPSRVVENLRVVHAQVSSVQFAIPQQQIRAIGLQIKISVPPRVACGLSRIIGYSNRGAAVAGMPGELVGYVTDK